MPPVPQRPVHPAGSPAEAIAGGYFAQVRFLLEMSGPAGADARDPASGRTPLMLCALVRDSGWAAGLARLLLEKGARVGLKDRQGLNALHYACAHGRDELSELYLQAIDYRVNDTDCYRNTAVHYAVRSGRPAIVDALLTVLKRFQLQVSPPNREGVTPLMLAYMGDRLDIADKLLAAGADAAAVDAFGKATAGYQREAEERLRDAADAAAAKAAGRKLRFDDVDGWRHYQTRLRSAPPGGRDRASGGGRTFKEAQREHRRSRMYQPDEAELIATASPLDRRNDPAEVFRSTPTDFFGPAGTRQPLSISGVGIAASAVGSRQTSAAAQRPRARSAMPFGERRFRQIGEDEDDDNNSIRSKDSREMRLLSACSTRGSGGGVLVQHLFSNYEYHCSPLYRPPPRVPDPAHYVHDFAARFLTPTLADSEGPGGAAGDSATPVGRRRKEAAARKGKRGLAGAAAAAAAAVTASETIKSRKAAGGSGTVGGRMSRAAFGREE